MKCAALLRLGLAGLGLALGACPVFAASGAAEAPRAELRVVGEQGSLRLYRVRTEPWPLQTGAPLPSDALLELDAGALLRLRYATYMDVDLAGPARCEVYEAPSPSGPGVRRVIVKLDKGFILVDGRFQFGRPAEILLSLPDRDLVFAPGQRFFAYAGQGRSAFYLPLTRVAGALVPATPGQGVLRALDTAKTVPAGTVPAALVRALTLPVPIFVLARDYNQDLGLWPRPAVLGPLLAERMAQIPGLEVVAGSGDTRFAYASNGALKKGQDDFLKGLALAQGARWVLVGNCVSDTPPQAGAASLRRVRGQAEVRLLEAGSGPGGLELVNESSVTSVARAGRPLEQASRQVLETASDEVARYLQGDIEDLLQGRAHAEVILQLEADNVDEGALRALAARLESMDSVRRVFRRRFARRTAVFDLILRKSAGDFEAQWAAAPTSGAWAWENVPSGRTDLWRVRALRGP